MTASVWPWAALPLLGAMHGINPGMGWLFAVALGLQDRSSRTVWRALLPLAAGHAMAMVAALAVLAAVGAVVPVRVLRWLVAAALVAVAVRSLVRHRHPRGGGMRMSARDLAVWSFLMASAHGAGLMVLPFAMRLGSAGVPLATMRHVHGAHDAALAGTVVVGSAPPLASAAAVLLHTGGYLLVTAAIAVLVYERLGLRMLRTAWVNLDLFWAIALLITAGITVMI